jgi:hypothetical protein
VALSSTPVTFRRIDVARRAHRAVHGTGAEHLTVPFHFGAPIAECCAKQCGSFLQETTTMTSKGRLWFAAACVSTLSAMACSSSSPPTEPPFSSGLPPDSVLGGLDGADLTGLCASRQKYLLSKPVVQEGNCRVAGGIAAAFAVLGGAAKTDADVQTSCAKGYDQCEAALASDAGVGDVMCSAPKPTCSATVREYETCVTDSVTIFQQIVDEMPACKDMKLSDIHLGDAGPSDPTIQNPASCEALKTKCPELFGSTQR